MATALATFIKTLLKEAIKKPNAAKALAKYSARGLVRKAGVFGIYGTIKKLQKLGNISKSRMFWLFTTSVIKKNVLRNLGPINYIIDIFKKKGGIKYAMKQFGWQHMTPMVIKKLWYLKQNYDNYLGKNNPFVRQAKSEIWKHLAMNNKKHTYLWKLNQIEGIMDAPEVPKKFKKNILDHWFYFEVGSPCGSFDRHSYKWHPITGELHAWVVSADKYGHPHKGAGPKEYIKMGVPLWLIRKSLMTTSYGKKIYWIFYKHRKH